MRRKLEVSMEMRPSLEKGGSRSKKKKKKYSSGPPQETERRWLTPIPDSKKRSLFSKDCTGYRIVLTMSPRTRLDLRTSEIGVPTPLSCDDRCRSMWLSGLSSCFCASRLTSFLLLDFSQLPGQNCLKFLPFLVHCSFCFRYFHRLRLQKKRMNQIVMGHRSFFFASHVGLHVFSTEKIPDVGRAPVRNCKDDSVSCAVFTEQCSSVLQMTAA